jgi:hypothetical protein
VKLHLILASPHEAAKKISHVHREREGGRERERERWNQLDTTITKSGSSWVAVSFPTDPPAPCHTPARLQQNLQYETTRKEGRDRGVDLSRLGPYSEAARLQHGCGFGAHPHQEDARGAMEFDIRHVEDKHGASLHCRKEGRESGSADPMYRWSWIHRH